MRRFHIRLEKEGEDQEYARGADDVASLMVREADGADRETFWVMALSASLEIIGLDTVSVGTLDQALISPREVFKTLILSSAASFICIHNHPSGDPTPSKDDKEITKRLQEVGKLHGIQMKDHIILGDDCFVSFSDEHML